MATKARVESNVCPPTKIERGKDGRITLSNPVAASTIFYTIDGGKRQRYTKPFDLRKGGTVTAYATATGMAQGMETTASFDMLDRKSTRLNSSHANISYAVFCLKKKKNKSLVSI